MVTPTLFSVQMKTYCGLDLLQFKWELHRWQKHFIMRIWEGFVEHGIRRCGLSAEILKLERTPKLTEINMLWQFSGRLDWQEFTFVCKFSHKPGFFYFKKPNYAYDIVYANIIDKTHSEPIWFLDQNSKEFPMSININQLQPITALF